MYRYIWRFYEGSYQPRPHNRHQREIQLKARAKGVLTSIKIKKMKTLGIVDEDRRTQRHGSQSLSSPSSTFPRFSLFLRLLSSSANVLTTGCIPPLPRASTLLCLFPKRPMGLTPRPTYQNGSISGPGRHTSTSVAVIVIIVIKRPTLLPENGMMLWCSNSL